LTDDQERDVEQPWTWLAARWLVLLATIAFWIAVLIWAL
jgi:hypothetical protein